ncbi:MAG: replicative DNA helicase [Acidimicrobiales bacterium]
MRSEGQLDQMLGRVAPHSIEAEESLLGAMLISREAVSEAVEVVTEDDFFKPSHRHIFRSIATLHAEGAPNDTVTVAEELKRAGVLDQVGGLEALVAIQASTPAISSAGRYAQIVEEYSLLRKLIRAASDIAELAYALPEDVAAAVDLAEAKIFEVAEHRTSDTMMPLREVLMQTLDDLESLYGRSDAVTGIPTGFIDLDEILSGLQPSNLVIVGARPGMGKTSFALGLGVNVAKAISEPVLMFSLEMSHQELTQRLVAAEARVDSTWLRSGRLQEKDWEKIHLAIGRLAEAKIFIDDDPNLTVLDIRARARRLKAREGLGLVVVDYLQLMSGRRNVENRQVEVSEISRGLKILARELNVPVIALSQLSRNLEARGDKRPILADLRESGSLEQDADVVMFIYRDEMYVPDTTDKGTAEVIIAKHRSGPTGTVYLAFLNHYTLFANMASI